MTTPRPATQRHRDRVLIILLGCLALCVCIGGLAAYLHHRLALEPVPAIGISFAIVALIAGLLFGVYCQLADRHETDETPPRDPLITVRDKDELT